MILVLGKAKNCRELNMDCRKDSVLRDMSDAMFCQKELHDMGRIHLISHCEFRDHILQKGSVSNCVKKRNICSCIYNDLPSVHKCPINRCCWPDPLLEICISMAQNIRIVVEVSYGGEISSSLSYIHKSITNDCTVEKLCN